MSSANYVVLRYVEETTYGQTPANSTDWQEVRYTSESLTGTPKTEQSKEVRSDRQIGDQFKVSVEVNGDVDGELSYGSYDSWIEGAMCNSWTSNEITTGTTAKSYSIEKEFSDLSAHKYIIFKGERVNTLEFNIAYGSPVTVSFGFAGNHVSGSDTSAVGTGSSASPTTTRVMNSVSDVINLKIDGGAFTGCLNSLKLNINNNLDPVECIGSDAPKDQNLGTSEVTGTIDAYLDIDGSNMSWYTDKILNQNSMSLEFTITDGTNSYTFHIPAMILSGDAPQSGGLNEKVTISGDFTGTYDSTSGYTLKITRA